MKNTFFLFFALFLLAACGSNHTHQDDDKDLLKAATLHQDAIDVEKIVKPKLDGLVQKKNSLNIQGRALTEAEMSFVRQVETLEDNYRYWTENHVEVPGHGHDGHDHGHGHDHDHDHDHGAQLEVSSADMLIIQQEFKDSIQAIQKRIELLEGL